MVNMPTSRYCHVVVAFFQFGLLACLNVVLTRQAYTLGEVGTRHSR